MEHRAPRCSHGFYRGLCAASDCEHWDGIRSHRGASKTIKHDAWGKNQRQRKTKPKQKTDSHP